MQQSHVKAFTNPQLLVAVGNSLIVAVCALAICLVIGIPTALALSRYDFPGKTVVRRLVILPITLPSRLQNSDRFGAAQEHPS